MLLKEIIPEHLFENIDFDYKVQLGDKPGEAIKWVKSIVAFASGGGGRVFFGIRDEDNEAVGLTREAVKTDILYINDICGKRIHASAHKQLYKGRTSNKYLRKLVNIIINI